MSLQTDLIEKVKQLPEDKQLLVKSLVDELARKVEPTAQGAPAAWFGSLEQLGITISEEDIADARREMWGNFPQEVDL
jgi:hypothetical protein